MASEELIKAVMVTAELMGTVLSADGARVMCDDLDAYPEPQVMTALTRCRREVRGRLTLADIIARLDDGRPGPDEAWAMIPRSEAETVVWTDEMSQALSVAQPLLDAGDQVAARMAFREAYARLVTQARADRLPVRWMPSLGHDRDGREQKLREAVQLGRLPMEAVARLLPAPLRPETQVAALLAGIAQDAVAKDMPTDAKTAREQIQKLRDMIDAKEDAA